jgi:hypothetical protein
MLLELLPVLVVVFLVQPFPRSVLTSSEYRGCKVPLW